MKLLMVTFPVKEMNAAFIVKEGKAHQYFASKQAAEKWIKEESPSYEDYNDITEVEVKPTKKDLASYLNEHHTYW